MSTDAGRPAVDKRAEGRALISAGGSSRGQVGEITPGQHLPYSPNHGTALLWYWNNRANPGFPDLHLSRRGGVPWRTEREVGRARAFRHWFLLLNKRECRPGPDRYFTTVFPCLAASDP